MEKVDFLAFGAHPDDIECGIGGTIAKLTRLGYKVGLVDLTLGEMATNGTIEQRQDEAYKAMEILGASFRINLEIPDRGINLTPENIEKVVEILRKAQPKVIAAPYWVDRHPDHERAGSLVKEGFFSAGLNKVLPEIKPIKRPEKYLRYFLTISATPSFVVDVTEYYSIKKRAVLAHVSQFAHRPEFSQTFLNEGQFLGRIESRDLFFGAQIGKRYGEGFVLQEFLELEHPLVLIK
ncbi:bacillithiol biosynthesis deacetylase BshB1 [Carboxydothermus ferrireducens]|uniref:Bacillithiol biosynthesis deacetylase BshB1 n=1 Tax=Carboxydothermus ferrireducens DSM 11255 TaxID=1119529 RepID=A0ABX2RB74_9THEO|nr:bacillithiol biosynthesis deacetylase BshB1 [Carboxydothermus ferrireducens]NYE57038.1 bacillithiol biosynthesis deacetylase BshB1 [Carboxydothermus ferrireducens DSM 11255]